MTRVQAAVATFIVSKEGQVWVQTVLEPKSWQLLPC